MLSEAELAEYCRKPTLYPVQIRAWRAACEQANDMGLPQAERLTAAPKDYGQRISVTVEVLFAPSSVTAVANAENIASDDLSSTAPQSSIEERGRGTIPAYRCCSSTTPLPTGPRVMLCPLMAKCRPSSRAYRET